MLLAGEQLEVPSLLCRLLWGLTKRLGEPSQLSSRSFGLSPPCFETKESSSLGLLSGSFAGLCSLAGSPPGSRPGLGTAEFLPSSGSKLNHELLEICTFGEQ